MEKLVTSSFRLGIVGGGQLGKMLALKAAEWDLKIHCLDKSKDAPASTVCDEFQVGDMTSYDDVLAFGQTVDVLTVESDHVNADALEALEKEGKRVFPKGKTLRIIQDKGLQRQFCQDQGLPVPKFEIFSSKQDLLNSSWKPPYIAKACQHGYDGKGVFLVKSESDIDSLPDENILVEEKVAIDKELTIIAVRNGEKEVACFPASELNVDESTYIVDHLLCPAKVEKGIAEKAKEIGEKLVEAFEIEGIIAIELFLDKDGNLWINECSPRPHNSGHHTIEAALTSQYEQHLRGILGAPLGSCEFKGYSGMVNLLGEKEASGDAKYEGLDDCLKMKGVTIHIYGKNKVMPNRKMGHITILSDSQEELYETVNQVRKKARVVSW